MTGQGLRTGARGLAVTAVLLLVGLLAPRLFPGSFTLQLMELVVVYGVLCLSLNIMVGYLGYLPFSQIACFGIGGYTGAILAEHLTTNLWIALGVAIGIAAVVSYLIGRLTLHLRGLYFAIVTLALAQLFVLAVTDLGSLTGGTNGISFNGYMSLPLPGKTVSLSDDLTSYTVTLVISVVIAVLLWLLMRSGAGRMAKAVRDNEALARSLGVRAATLKLAAFMLASAVAAIAGVMYFAYFALVSPGTFDLDSSLLLLLMIVLGGKHNFWTPVIGAALFEVIPNVVSLSDDVKWLLFGAVMVLVVTMLPDGIGGAAARTYHRLSRRREYTGEQLDGWIRGSVARSAKATGAPVALAVHGVAKDYGGVRALDAVSFEVRSGGEVLGLIGPNGSGKTTMLNVISGFGRLDRGHVELHGKDVTRLPPERIVRLGLTRTFQEEAAFPTLTVAECEQVARAAGASNGLFSLVFNAIRTEVHEAPGGSTPAGELSHGSQRLLAIALAFASAPAVILLDEPAAGLGPDESDAVAAMIRLSSGHGVSVVLVEHHMEMVMDVCDRVVVLSNGSQLATGTPAEVTSNASVVSAYLGSFGEAARRTQEVDAG